MEIQTGEQFAELYQDYGEKIFRFLYWRTGNRANAEDLTSETFVRAWQGRRRFDGRQPAAWLYQIARRLLIDFWRKKKPVSLSVFRPDHPSLAYDQDLPGQAERSFQSASIHQALQRLAEPLQSVVILRFFEEYSVREVAQILKLSEGNVRVIQYRALKQLRKSFLTRTQP